MPIRRFDCSASCRCSACSSTVASCRLIAACSAKIAPTLSRWSVKWAGFFDHSTSAPTIWSSACRRVPGGGNHRLVVGFQPSLGTAATAGRRGSHPPAPSSSRAGRSTPRRRGPCSPEAASSLTAGSDAACMNACPLGRGSRSRRRRTRSAPAPTRRPVARSAVPDLLDEVLCDLREQPRPIEHGFGFHRRAFRSKQHPINAFS